MKTSKSLILASLFAIALSNMASAATIIRFTGSTAFRAETTQAIIKVLGGATATFALIKMRLIPLQSKTPATRLSITRLKQLL